MRAVRAAITAGADAVVLSVVAGGSAVVDDKGTGAVGAGDVAGAEPDVKTFMT